ncbi:MAG: PspA/IM30 family protein [Candidatus Thermochlorobacter sp.]
MAGLFRRIFRVAQSEAHAVVDKMEDPVKMTEQGIRELRTDLAKSIQALAQVKAVAVRLRKDGEDQLRQAQEYERKAMALLQRAQAGDLDMAEAERLATEALNRKQEFESRGRQLLTDAQVQQQQSDALQAKVQKLQSTITRYENELVTLKGRAKAAEATKKINQQLSGVDSSGTIAMLEKMKERVTQTEAEAEAYAQIADATTTVDDQINRVLATPSKSAASDSLLELKRKMGMLPAGDSGTSATSGASTTSSAI